MPKVISSAPIAMSFKSATPPSGLNRRALLAGLGAGSLLQAAPGHAATELPVSNRELWSWTRAQQLFNPQLAYLDVATSGPGLRSALVASYRQQEDAGADIEAYRRQNFSGQAIGALAKRLAELLDCDADEVTLTRGASEALNIVANGLELAAGDEIVTTGREHGSAINPWLLQAARRGVIVKQVPLPTPLEDNAQALGLLASAVTDRTRVIAISHLQHTDGAVLPAAEICAFARQRNILSVVDGAQACGSLDASVRAIDCDFYAASLHKWLNGPAGTGLLYVRRERLNQLWPLAVDSAYGWSAAAADSATITVETLQREHWPATWRKFSWHGPDFGPLLKALSAALDFRAALGADRIEARIRELAIYARLRLQPLSGIELLTPAQPGMWGGIVAFRPRSGSVRELAERLTRRERAIVSALEHPPTQFAAVRACFHIYNSHDDVERLVQGVQKHS